MIVQSKSSSDLNLSSEEAIVTVTDEVLPVETEAQRCVDSLHSLVAMFNHEKRCFLSNLNNSELQTQVHLRGLPYRATEREIADWLTEAADPVEASCLETAIGIV